MPDIKLLPTGINNLDIILNGGLPVYSLNIIGGPPGTGKTILAQQIVFNHIQRNPEATALYLTTLSEPRVKVVRYMQHFAFFEPDLFGERVIYRDVGLFIRDHTLSELLEHILYLVEEHQAELLVIDSLKAIYDLTGEPGKFRLFCYDLSIRLVGVRCTTCLVGEYERSEIAGGAEFAVADGIIYLDIAHQEGELKRFLQVYKLRGGNPIMEPVPFYITNRGIHILSSKLTLRQRQIDSPVERGICQTGISGLDDLLGGGIPTGHSIILSGVSGTGKTTFAVQFLIEGVRRGEKCLLFSFEETPHHLYRMAEGFGWDLPALEEQGLLRIRFVAQTEIRIEENLEQMLAEIEAFQPQRFVIDSFSIFLHRVQNPAIQREKTYLLATLAQQMGTVSFLISDIPANEPHRLSRFGVEETVTDGTIVLSTEMETLQRKRYLEVYKMRAAHHTPGRHRMKITGQGIELFYVTAPPPADLEIPPLVFGPVQKSIQGDLRYNSTWLVRGEPGVGKSTLSYQFAIEGLRRKESVLYVAADISAAQAHQALLQFGFLPEPYLESGRLVILDGSHEREPTINLHDSEIFLFTLLQQLEKMERPLRLVFDSLNPLSLSLNSEEFVALINRKNRLLCQPGIVLFDTKLRHTLERRHHYSLFNAYDVVLDMYTPDWGDMSPAGRTGYHVLQVHKARGTNVDPRPYPYVISRTEGIIVQSEYYRQQMGL